MTNKDKEKLESEYFRSYSDLRKYKHQYTDGREEIMFALHHPGGGVTGEIVMVWKPLNGRMVPQLQSYDDSWKVLSCFTDLIDRLGDFDGDNITPDEFIEILESLGFISTNLYEGDYIPDEMFREYQEKRKKIFNRNRNLESLSNLE